MACCPLGTLNHFAKDLRVLLDINETIRTIAGGHWFSIDTGEVNRWVFLDHSSLGFCPDTVRQRELQQSRLRRDKWLEFFWAAVTSLRRYPFLPLTLPVDEQTYKKRTPFIFIGNNGCVMEGLHIGARTALNAGQLSL